VRYLGWGFQVLILAVLIHLFLRFVRTTRGNRLIRGLFLAVMVGVVGLWGLSRALRLEELEHLLESSTGFVFVGFVVVFQSELRRGIAQLGERTLLGLVPSSQSPAAGAAAEAARALAARRRGALIVFERETALHTVLETGTPIDADAKAALLESLFHPETPLHDGAVVIRKERVAAAGCILPLSEETLPSPTMGTRHRAGLGVSEESDAVVLIVSEETGSISLAKDGKFRMDVAPAELEQELQRLLQRSTEAGGEGGGLAAALLASLRKDLVWLPSSLLLALGIFWIAHQDLQESKDFRVRFVGGEERRDKEPRPGEVLVLLASEEDQLVESRDHTLEVRGTRRQLERLGGAVRGVLRIDDEDWNGGPVETRDIRWQDEGGFEYRWKGGETPELVARRFERRTFRLQASELLLDTKGMNPRLALDRTRLRFEPSATVEVHGPTAELARLGEGPLALDTIVVGADEGDELREPVRLHPNLRERRLELVGETVVVAPIVPVAREIDTLTVDVALVCLDPARADELARWRLPARARTARFSVRTLGLIPQDADPASPAMRERFEALRRFVRENLRVFVDVSELAAEASGRSLAVRWTWRQVFVPEEEASVLGGAPALDVELVSEPEVLLEPRTP